MSLPSGKVLLIGLLMAALSYPLISSFLPKTPKPGAASSQGRAHEDDARQSSSSPSATADRAGTTDYVGVILPSQEATLSSSAEGLVEAVKVNLGDSVREGDVLVTLDSERRLRSQLAEAQAVVNEASQESARTEAAKDHAIAAAERQKRAFADGATSEGELSNAQHQVVSSQFQWEGAKAKLTEKQATVQRVTQQLKDAEIRAPFHGKVAARYIQKGERIQAGKPIFRLVGAAPPIVRFAVPQEFASALTSATTIEVRIDSDSRILQGKISRVAPALDPVAHMIIVEAILDERQPSDVLLGGVAARVRLQRAQAQLGAAPSSPRNHN